MTEIQLFNEGGDRDHPAQNTAPSVKLAEDTSMTGNLYTTLKATCTDDGMPYDKDMSYVWKLVSAPEGAEVILSSANKPTRPSPAPWKASTPFASPSVTAS